MESSKNSFAADNNRSNAGPGVPFEVANSEISQVFVTTSSPSKNASTMVDFQELFGKFAAATTTSQVSLDPIQIPSSIFTSLLTSLQGVQGLCQKIDSQHELLVSQQCQITNLQRQVGHLGSNIEALQVETGVLFPRFKKLPNELQDMIVSPWLSQLK